MFLFPFALSSTGVSHLSTNSQKQILRKQFVGHFWIDFFRQFYALPIKSLSVFERTRTAKSSQPETPVPVLMHVIVRLTSDYNILQSVNSRHVIGCIDYDIYYPSAPNIFEVILLPIVLFHGLRWQQKFQLLLKVDPKTLM